MPSQPPSHVLGNLPHVQQPMIPPPPLRSAPSTYSTQGTLPYEAAVTRREQQSQELPLRNLSAVPADISGSKQSFQQAMGNPCEFFVDVM